MTLSQTLQSWVMFKELSLVTICVILPLPEIRCFFWSMSIFSAFCSVKRKS